MTNFNISQITLIQYEKYTSAPSQKKRWKKYLTTKFMQNKFGTTLLMFRNSPM